MCILYRHSRAGDNVSVSGNGRLPLEGVLVLDLTRAVAGPFGTMLLGDLGARVIKIEEPDRGDETRYWGPPFLGDWSTYFLSINRNKESVALDLKSAAGRRAVQRIAARADVVVENFRPGVMDRLGLGLAELARRNPRLIYASISDFGQTGPDRGKAGYDLIIQGMSGLMRASAGPDEEAVKVAFPVSDILTSLFAGQAILASLYSREKDGRGRYIEVSLLEGMLSAMCSLVTGTLLTGQEPERVGTAQHNIVPYQMFHCRDAPIVFGSPNERLWQRLCEALEHPQWLEDPRFQGNAARNQHRAELVGEMEAVLRTRPAAHWLERLERCEVPCGPVCSISEALSLPQVAARGTVVECDHAELGRLRLVGNPMRMAGTPFAYRAPPGLGEHTQAVMQEFFPGEPEES